MAMAWLPPTMSAQVSCRSGCGWWRPPLVCWSAPLCQILLLVAVARLAGPSRKGASRTASASLAVGGCNSVARFPDSQPCREFQPHLANQCKVRLIPVSPDQTWFILHDKMHARLNVCQFTAVKNDSCIACTARIIHLYCCTRTVCASQINIESCAAEDPADTSESTF